MTGRIFTCAHCGKRAVDTTVNGNKRFCSAQCAKAARFVKPTPCPHNPWIRCTRRDCANCGWNPKVAKARTAAYARSRKAARP